MAIIHHMVVILPAYLTVVMFPIRHKVFITTGMFIMPCMLMRHVVMAPMPMELVTFMLALMVTIMDTLHTTLLKIQQIFITKMVLPITILIEINRVWLILVIPINNTLTQVLSTIAGILAACNVQTIKGIILPLQDIMGQELVMVTLMLTAMLAPLVM